MEPFDALILAGGAARRMSGADKAVLEVGGARLLDRALDAVHGAGTVVVVGPPRPVSRDAVFTREEPAGSGPAAAIAHGLGAVSAPVVVLIAVDAPFAASAVPRLLAALRSAPDADAAMLVDETGRRQPLVGAYRCAALRRRVGDESWAGRAVRQLVADFRVAEVRAVALEAFDCDTPDDLARARDHAQQGASRALTREAAAPESSRRTPRSRRGR